MTTARIVGRGVAAYPGTVLRQRGLEFTIRNTTTGEMNQVMCIGGAASWPLASIRTARATRTYADFIRRDANNALAGLAHTPFGCHTSLGTTVHFERLADALAEHVPWERAAVNFQVEGASAVNAACEMLLAARGGGRVAVCERSYHGPPGHSYGARPARHGVGLMTDQVMYPIDMMGHPTRAETIFNEWHSQCGNDVGVLLIEPQSGSSLCGRPWNAEALRRVARAAREKNIMVCSDEVMCGMGRHGQGGLFLSSAWRVETDAVVFGKGVAGGFAPLAGALVRDCHASIPLHCHTYAGAIPHTATAALCVLQEIRNCETNVRLIHEMLSVTMKAAGAAYFKVHGQGAMWGLEWNLVDQHHEQAGAALRRACRKHDIWPYFVQGGAMVTPPLDADLKQLERAMKRLIAAAYDPEFRATLDNLLLR